MLKQQNLRTSEVSTAASFFKKNAGQNYKEIIVDEAQDLTVQQLNGICSKAEKLSIGADFNQQIYKDKISQEQAKNLLQNNEEFKLEKIYRNSFNILNFITQNWHPSLYTPEELELLRKEKLGKKPTLCIGVDFIFDIISEYGNSTTHNIAILCFKQENVEKYHKMLKNKGLEHTYYYSVYFDDDDDYKKYINGEIFTNLTEKLSNLHITTFHSAKGLEFDTVIIPDFEIYESHFVDFKTMKKQGRKNELKALNVALTRAKLNLYLVANKEISFLKDESTYTLLKRENMDDDDDFLF